MEVSRVAKTQNTQEDLGLKRSAQSGVADFTNSIMTGGNLDKSITGTIDNTAKNAEANLKQMIQDAIVKGLQRLFLGNDAADATTSKASTAKDVSQTAAKVTATQQKLLTTGLQALRDLVTSGEMDINTYAAKIKDACKTIEDKNNAAQSLNEQKQSAMQQNEEIAQKLNELGVTIKVSKSDGNSGEEQTISIIQNDKDGKPVKTEMKTQKTSNNKNANSTANFSSEIQELLSQYQTNMDIISVIDTQISQMASEANSTITEAQSDQENIVSSKETLTQNVQDTSNQVIQNAQSNISSTVSAGNTTLKADATQATVNGTVDTTTAAAAPGIAAGLEVGTFGFGSGQAAQVVSNGVQDGIASGMRVATGSAAVGGISANMMAGRSLGDAMSQEMVKQANNFVSTQISEMASGVQSGELDIGSLVAPELVDAVKIEGPQVEQKSV